MKYIIFDLEWNQAADATSIIQEPVYLTGEIVEIGAVKLDEKFCPMDELRLYIVPQYYMHTAVSSGSWCGGQRQQCGDSGSGLR